MTSIRDTLGKASDDSDRFLWGATATVALGVMAAAYVGEILRAAFQDVEGNPIGSVRHVARGALAPLLNQFGSVPLLNLEGYYRQVVQARDNACAGRPLRPFPADILQH